MNIDIIVLLSVNLALLGLLIWRQLLLRSELQQLRMRFEHLDALPRQSNELMQEAQAGTVLISLRILNPMQLAINKVWLAGIAGRITPTGIRRIVAHEAVKQIDRELERFGVVAQVKAVDHR